MQVPVTYHVEGASSVRCGGVVKAPYSIINLSVENTVWISQNAGMRIGEGVPLYPGTTFTWQYDGDFYALSDGPNVSGSDIIATNDVIDWSPNPVATAIAIINSGLILIDQPVQLLSEWIDAAGTTIDISRYQSVIISAFCSNSGGTYDQMTISFAGLFEKAVMFYQANDSASIWEASLPAVADTLTIKNTSASVHPIGIAVIVWGSNRPVEGITQFHMRDTGGNPPVASAPYFFFDSGLTIHTGTQLDVNIPPWFGEIEVDIELTSAAALGGGSPLILSMQNTTTGIMNTFRRIIPLPVMAGSTVYKASTRIGLSGHGLRISQLNASGGSFTNVAVRIAPIAGFGAVS